ncbi:MAG: metallophosphoesterase, partial [Planctomycetes bacterium]|nr:metallophosphoesterase [Planctomycetota bacterium]
PRCSWLFEESRIDKAILKSIAGPDLVCDGEAALEKVSAKSCIRIDGLNNAWRGVGKWGEILRMLPEETLTISAWLSLDETLPFGGVVSAFQDNGDAEKGWVLGYNSDRFTFGLATEGSDDGNGRMTYLEGKTAIQRGKWYHVCGVYDGQRMELWVDGELDAESASQRGRILYPEDGNLVIGAYSDLNEHFVLDGRISQVAIFDLAAKPAWVAHDFEHQKAWTALPPSLDAAKEFGFLVKPYLQYATRDSIRVMCEVSRPASVFVRYGEDTQFRKSVEARSEDRLLHTAELKDLKPETGYFYQVVVREEGAVPEIATPHASFQTASLAETPFAFAIIADTQGNPSVNGKLAQHAWALRPNFTIIPGDLVDDGTIKNQWVQEFFASMNPLFSRSPFYPVLGNHERNADHYYRYMDLPPPEYYYSFEYGNAAFFMLDSNKKVGPESEQYLWLEAQLQSLDRLRKSGDSKIVWTFVSFHHPSYSSDEDDYGNLWKGKSSWGDLRIRPLCELFDRYGIDIVWNGHIHSYERTWPIRSGRVVQEGPIYMITGGGGGGLEQSGPIRPPFQNNVKRGHHFVYVSINGGTLELKAYDLAGMLFDQITLRKPK